MARVAWFLPEAGTASGGLATALAHAAALERRGHACPLHIPDDDRQARSRRILADRFGIAPERILAGHDGLTADDAAVATSWLTVPAVARSGAGTRLLFAQDWEPAFAPSGDDQLRLERALTHGLTPIALGRWLAARLEGVTGLPAHRCEFGVDRSVYVAGDATREDAVCFVLQPTKDRRAPQTGLNALELLKRRRPQTRIYLFGHPVPPKLQFEATWLGFLPPSELAALYRRCRVGLCLSATNPSRIPFEMMSCGLPVSELYRASTLLDLPSRGCQLTFQSPVSIAYSLHHMLDAPERTEALGAAGEQFMAARTRIGEEAATVAAIERVLAGDGPAAREPESLLYDRPPIVAPADDRPGVHAFLAAERRRALALAAGLSSVESGR